MTQINLSKSAMAAIAACVVGTAGSMAWFGIHKGPSLKVSVEIDPNSKTQQTVPNTSPQAQPPTVPSQSPVDNQDNQAAIYRTEPTQNGFKTVQKPLPLKEPTQSPEDNLRSAFGELLADSKSAAKTGKEEAVSTIPPNTKLLALRIGQDGVHVDLSKEFEGGGGSTSMQARLAEIIYTATSMNHNAKVWITIEGKKLEVLGGEGIEVPYPLTRKILETEFESLKSQPE